MGDIEEQRKYYERMMAEVGSEYRHRVSDLEAENEKLRELVRDMADWAYISDYCDLGEQFADRMRELGVEV